MLGMLVCGVFNLVFSVSIVPIVYHVRLDTCHYSNQVNVSANANPATILPKNQTQTTQTHPPTTPSASSKHVSYAPPNAKPVKITILASVALIIAKSSIVIISVLVVARVDIIIIVVFVRYVIILVKVVVLDHKFVLAVIYRIYCQG